MSISINHNLMAGSAALNLSRSYNSMSTSVTRLSSGLRINSSADDAAGLAIRELMRSDISTLNQGIRNANDAVSIVQTADGALQVVDEKLIRMKELAEQAATGSYTSDQRLIIDSEYQAMASEITRIASATDFNGIYLLNGNLESSVHDGSGVNPAGKLKIHFGTGNSSAEDYYYIQIGDCRAEALGIGNNSTPESAASSVGKRMQEAVYQARLLQQPADFVGANSAKNVFASTFSDTISAAIQYDNHLNPVTGAAYTATEWGALTTQQQSNMQYQWASETAKAIASGNITPTGGPAAINTAYISADFQNAETALGALGFSAADVTELMAAAEGKASTYNANYAGNNIQTQENAQKALTALNSAIISKDKIRAELGAVQNRLENTISNLQTQAENLQSSESHISDVDVSTEMTEFVRQQILTQSGVAMLSQANSLPKMVMQLISG